MAEGGTMHYSKAQQEWRSQRTEADKRQQKFYEDLNVFPNLFSLRKQFHDVEEMEALLERQQTELKDGCFQYSLETMRCHNLIIFLMFLLGRKQQAWEYCESLKGDESQSRSVIFQTLIAVLQWEFSYKTECLKTIGDLQDLYKEHDCDYRLAVAVAEKGHLLICTGPRGFLRAMDLFDEAISKCSNSDVFLWKFDLALAIRRNFSVYAYSEHPKLSSSTLAITAAELLMDTAHRCPNEVYKTRGMVELARLISHLKIFKTVCGEEDRKIIANLCKDLCKNHDDRDLFEKALTTESGKNDHYVLRECGRFFLYAKEFERAVGCFADSCRKREHSQVYQLFGKAYLYMYSSHFEFISPPTVSLDELQLCRVNAGQSSDQHRNTASSDAYCSGPAAGPPENASGCECPPGKCPMKLNTSEARRLKTEFDETPYMDSNGTLQTTQSQRIGNIRLCHIPSNRAWSTEEAMLLETYEEGTYLNDDGTFRTTQQEGIGNIQIPPHRSTAGISSSTRNKHKLQTRHSFPPSSGSPHQQHKNFNTAAMKRVLKLRNYSYDISDHRIETAKYFYEKAIRFNIRNQAALYETGRLYEGMQKPEEALKLFKQIISDKDRTTGNAIQLVNAYEQSGLCLLQMSESCTDSEKDRLTTRAKDMFMSCLLECRQAVAHLPKISSNRADLWESYPKLLNILRQSDHERVGQLQKEAQVHEVVGKHLEAIHVYQEVMALAKTSQDRTAALCRSLSNYLSMGNVKEAKFILDVFLTSPNDREFILTDDTAQELREVGVKVFREAARQLLERGDLSDARDAFRSALLMKNKVLDPRSPEAARGDAAAASAQNVSGQFEEQVEQFDICVFFDNDSPVTVTQELEDTSNCLATAMRDVFGMRVSVNDEGAGCGRLSFESELRLAQSASLVMLVIGPVPYLSPRMSYIVDTALSSSPSDHVLPVSVGDSGALPPTPLRCLEPYCGAEELLKLTGSNANEHVLPICRLFDFLLEGARPRRM